VLRITAFRSVPSTINSKKLFKFAPILFVSPAGQEVVPSRGSCS